MTPQTKKIAIIAGAITLAILITGVVCYSIFDTARSNLVAEINALPPFNSQEVYAREAMMVGHSWPVPPPSISASEISRNAKIRAERLAEGKFTTQELNKVKNEAVKNLKSANVNQVTSFKLNNGFEISGKVLSIRRGKVKVANYDHDYAIPTESNSSEPNAIAPAYKYLFSVPDLNRAKLRASADAQVKFQSDKQKFIQDKLAQFESKDMQKNLYTIRNNRWISVKSYIEQRYALAYDEYKKNREAKIDQLLKEKTCFGHEFTREELNIDIIK